MAKWYGNIGFGETIETEPSVWETSVTEKRYVGELLSNRLKYQSSNAINDNINISNKISIISDIYANNNIRNIKYAEFMGIKWKVIDVEIAYPRIILSLGGVYNE